MTPIGNMKNGHFIMILRIKQRIFIWMRLRYAKIQETLYGLTIMGTF